MACPLNLMAASQSKVGHKRPFCLIITVCARTRWPDLSIAESHSGFSWIGRLIVVMDYRGFEAEFLRLAFTTSYELSPSAAAFLLGLPVPRATEFMQRMVDEGTLELDSNDVGHLRYIMPDRPGEPLFEEGENTNTCDCTLALTAGPSQDWSAGDWDCTAMIPRFSTLPETRERISPARATAALFINALVCPGIGSMVGGRNAVGVAQMSLFMVGLPLAVVNVGLPLLAAAWAWGIFSGAKLVSEASE